MRAVLSAWFVAGVLAALALLTLKALAPEADGRAPVDEYAQVLRVHLPWLVGCIAMAFSAGAYVRSPYTSLARAVAALPVPVAGSFLAAAFGIPMSDTPLAVGLHLIEAVLGVVLGLFLSGIIADRRDFGRAPEGALWRETE